MKIESWLLALPVAVFTLANGQTNTNSTVNVAELHRQMYSAVSWGALMNGIQVGGARNAQPGVHRPDKCPIMIFLCSTNASIIPWLVPPPEGYRLDLSLLDVNEKLVERTPKGDALCKPVTAKVKSEARQAWEERKAFALLPGVPRQYTDLVELLECFKVKEPGTYTLVIKARIYKALTYPDTPEFPLPEARLKIILTAADFEQPKK
jgi:hypothetical protein